MIIEEINKKNLYDIEINNYNCIYCLSNYYNKKNCENYDVEYYEKKLIYIKILFEIYFSFYLF